MRAVLAVVGVFNIALGLGFLLSPMQMAEKFFIAPMTVQGIATIRADFPAFFITASLFALYGAWTMRRTPLLVPLGLLSIALFGRFVSIALDGLSETTFPPMIAEAAMIAVVLVAYRLFDRPAQLVQ
jgi:hypothetical protein